MKKLFGTILLCTCALALAGCGCSKSYDVECEGKEDGIEVFYGVNLKDNKVDEIYVEMTFENKEQAKEMYELIKGTGDYKLDGKTISTTMADEGEQKEYTKEDFIKEQEADGFTCK